MNCIKAALNDYGMSVADLSRESGVPYTTLNAMVTGSSKVDNMGITRFLKVAHVFGLTGEQLYYYCDKGKAGDRSVKYADPRQAEINEAFESVTEQGKDVMWTNAIMARNTFLENGGGNTVQTAI